MLENSLAGRSDFRCGPGSLLERSLAGPADAPASQPKGRLLSSNVWVPVIPEVMAQVSSALKRFPAVFLSSQKGLLLMPAFGGEELLFPQDTDFENKGKTEFSKGFPANDDPDNKALTGVPTGPTESPPLSAPPVSIISGQSLDCHIPCVTDTVSNLDEESRWTVHYTAPWHQQENVFLPTTRPPCVEDLHRQAKLNLKSVLRECDKLRRDGYRSSQYYSQGPTFAASSGPLCDDYQDEDEETDQKVSNFRTQWKHTEVSSGSLCSLLCDLWRLLLYSCRQGGEIASHYVDLCSPSMVPTTRHLEKLRGQRLGSVLSCSVSSSEEERLISTRRPKTPTSSDFSDLNTQTNWTKSLPLPTPEEKMRQQAQTVQADVVPINITASGGTGQDDGGHSVFTPDHYSTLGRLGSCRAAGQRSETRDSSCQTEEVKVVPPSMRRIRAQKGQGIAAQMSHFSGSSGNMSVLSDSAGIVFPSRLNSDAGFHSLPRSGARANVQSLEPRLGDLGSAEDVDGTSPYQQGHPHVDEDLGHPRGASRTGTPLRPKSQELRHFEAENVTSPACVVSPHATYSTSIIPNATLSSSSEASDPHSSSASALLSLCDSTVSLNAGNRENGSQAMAYNCRNSLSFPAHPQDVDGRSESSYSGGRGLGSSEPWEYNASGNGRASPLKPRVATPGYCTPGSNMSSCSLDQTSNRDDARSVYSEDHDGYCPSLHTDSGNLCSGSDGLGNPRHSVVNVFDGRTQNNPGDRANYQDKSLSRSISLKKAKKPPLPPSRTDSLRRIPKKSVQSHGQVLNESLIASLQHSLQLNLPDKGGTSPSQSPCSDFEEPWLPRSRSQSTVSAGSSLTSATTPNIYSLSGVTPAQSDTSSVRSEYTDPWGYYIDYTGVQEDPGNPVPPPAPPLDPKLMKDARPFKKSGQPEPSQEACRQPSTKEEGSRPPMPLVTTEALQMVQLRPVKKNSGTEGALFHEHASQEKPTPVIPQYHLKPSAFLKSRNSTNEMESESQPASATSSLLSPAKSSTQGHQDSAAERSLQSHGPSRAGNAEAGPGPGPTPPHEPPGPSPSRKPPPISKKPKLFLLVPPPQRDFTVEPAENVSEVSPSPTRGEAQESCADGAGSDESDSGSSVLAGGAVGSKSLGRVEANVPMVQPDALPAPTQEEPGTGGSVESDLSLQDPGPGVRETDTVGSSSEACDFLKEDGSDEVMTPSRPRTTEDLFAAIHRSKRKVLGRKDSEDDHSRNHSPSPPVTPTGAAPSLASQKQVGSIQRSVRKSSTSSDNFKALLLKKGSRSDTSARMSAAEMLKNTDPRFQRSRSEPGPDTPESPSSCSPSKNRRAQEEWAKNEGLMPRSLSFSGPRYGRSRTPPSAASSRYSVRNRIQSSPMTVISEGEGETTEAVDSRAPRAPGAERGCSLDGLPGYEMDESSLFCGVEPAASLGAQAPGPMEGPASAAGRDLSEQRGGPPREGS
ncbi:NHS-like protein [Camelus ferus]|nr:NHS-like protein [Camelus ferus]